MIFKGNFSGSFTISKRVFEGSYMKQIKTIIPLSLFKKNAKEYLLQAESGLEPIMLTLHGRGAFVIQTVDSFNNMNELAEFAVQQNSVAEALRRVDDYSSEVIET